MKTLHRPLALLLCLLLFMPSASAYSVLTHEEIIDLLWDGHIKPLLLAKYPNATAEELKEAHAYAYGGSVIQDLGYYPFGNHYFSDLVHYVRSGDFVVNMINDAQDIKELAFALGALGHYTSDVTGHPAVNRSVAIEFPKLAAKYGNKVTYAQDTGTHLKTEFGFDMSQVAKHRYTSDAYHDFIGFEVSKGLLERAFLKTYGLQLKDVLTDEDRAIGSFRRSVSGIVPEMTRIALATRKKELMKDNPTFAQRKFIYRLSRSQYEKDWGNKYYKAGLGTRLLAFLLRLLPRIGPFKALGFKVPTPQTEDLYFKSVNATVDLYGHYLDQVRDATVALENRDFDTGEVTHAGEYPPTGATYDTLTGQLAKKNFTDLTPELKANILKFYDGASPSGVSTKNRDSVAASLEKLKQAQPPAEQPSQQPPGQPKEKTAPPSQPHALSQELLGTNLTTFNSLKLASRQSEPPPYADGSARRAISAVGRSNPVAR